MRWVFLLNLARLLSRAYELGIDVVVFKFYSSMDQQARDFCLCSSREAIGLHPKWLAVDLALVEDVDADGDVDKHGIRERMDPRYTTLGQYWESLGGVWGGRDPGVPDIYCFRFSESLQL